MFSALSSCTQNSSRDPWKVAPVDAAVLCQTYILEAPGQCIPVHPPYSSVFSTDFNPEYGNTDLLFWLRKRSSPKYGNAHGHLNIFLR